MRSGSWGCAELDEARIAQARAVMRPTLAVLVRVATKVWALLVCRWLLGVASGRPAGPTPSWRLSPEQLVSAASRPALGRFLPRPAQRSPRNRSALPPMILAFTASVRPPRSRL